MMKIVFAGTPEFAARPLAALLQTRHQVVAVYTQPDRPAGRGRKLTQSSVKQVALAHGIEVQQPENLRDEAALRRLAAYQHDLMIVAAYGLILPTSVLAMPALGCINLHASLLPRWRGASPIQSAILADDRESGVTLMQMDAGLDTGPMLAKTRVPITQDVSAAMLHDQLCVAGTDLLLEHLDAIEQQTLVAEEQDEALATYAPKLTREQAKVDWTQSAHALSLQVRAYNSWPVSHSTLEQKMVRIWRAQRVAKPCEAEPGTVIAHTRSGIDVCCGEDVLRIFELQFAGKKVQTADQLLNARSVEGLTFV